MRIAFISDLHLAPGKLNRCTSKPAKLLSLLDALEERVERVILLGDAFDLLRPPRWRGWATHHALLRAEHPDLIDRLHTLDTLHGNHDAPMAARGWPEERVLHRTPVGSILAMHGHQWDVWLKKIWGIEEAANFGAGWFERAGLGRVSSLMGSVPTLVDDLQRRLFPPEPVVLNYASGALSRDQLGARAALSSGYGVVAAGHTHGLGLYALDHGLYINSGSHAHGYMDAALLDTEHGVAVTWRDRRVAQTAWRDARENHWVIGKRARARHPAVEPGHEQSHWIEELRP